MGIESFKAIDVWHWHFHNRHGIGNKVERGESGSADINAVELFRLIFNRLMSKECLHLGQLDITQGSGFNELSLHRISSSKRGRCVLRSRSNIHYLSLL